MNDDEHPTGDSAPQSQPDDELPPTQETETPDGAEPYEPPERQEPAPEKDENVVPPTDQTRRPSRSARSDASPSDDAPSGAVSPDSDENFKEGRWQDLVDAPSETDADVLDDAEDEEEEGDLETTESQLFLALVFGAIVGGVLLVALLFLAGVALFG